MGPLLNGGALGTLQLKWNCSRCRRLWKKDLMTIKWGA
jgi:hypothetical protein